MSTQLSKWMIEDDGTIHKVVNFYTAKQAADQLKITERQLVNLIESGKLAGKQVADTWLVAPEDLDAIKEKPTAKKK